MNLRTHPVAISLIALNCVIYLIAMFTSSVGNLNWLQYKLALDISQIAQNSEFWRLITSMFVHADFLHLLFNMVALIIFGNYAEKLLGRLRTLVIYFGSGIMANLFAWMYANLFGIYDYFALGASGAIMGLIAADAWVMKIIWQQSRNPIAYMFIRQILVILFLQLMLDLIVVQNSLAHHFAGALSGFLICFFLIKGSRLLKFNV